MLGITLVKPISLSVKGLLSYISYLKKNSLSSARYETELWSRIATTVTVVIMPILALLFRLWLTSGIGLWWSHYDRRNDRARLLPGQRNELPIPARSTTSIRHW